MYFDSKLDKWNKCAHELAFDLVLRWDTNIRDIRYSRSKKGWCSMLLLKAEQELAVSPAHASYAKKLQITPLFIGPVQTYPDTFESTTFSFRDGHPSTHIQCWSAPFWIRSPGWKVLNPLHVFGYAWCNKIDPISLPTVNTVFTWQPLLMLCHQYSQRSLASTVFQASRVRSAELRKLEHVSTNRIKVLRLWLTCFEDWPIRILTFA